MRNFPDDDFQTVPDVGAKRGLDHVPGTGLTMRSDAFLGEAPFVLVEYVALRLRVLPFLSLVCRVCVY